MKDAITSIQIVEFKPEHHHSLIQEELPKCYQEVYAGHPWHEWKWCAECEKKFGRHEVVVKGSDSVHCPHCQGRLRDFWTREQVLEDFSQEMAEHDSFCILALDKRKLVGFTWGFGIEPKALEEHLELDGVERQVKKFFPNLHRVAYLDELGVLERYRESGIAKAMFKRHLEMSNSAGLRGAVVRTRSNPPTVVYGWFLRLGYEVIAHYNDEGKRVVMAVDIGQLLAKLK